MRWPDPMTVDYPWTRWFAWHPVIMDDDRNTRVWWEWVERKRVYLVGMEGRFKTYLYRECQ